MKSRTTGQLFLISLAAAGALVLVAVRSAAIEAAYPVERVKGWWTRCVASRIVGCLHSGAASAENVRLRTEVASLQVVRGEARRLEEENARLRRALGFAERVRKSWFPAEVLSRGGSAAGVAGGILRIGKGTLAGVREGAVVQSAEGLVGRVRSVTPHTAEVQLLTESSLRVMCEIEGASGATLGVLSGGGQEALRLRYLRSVAGIRPGLAVVTSGRGGVFPRGIRVGTVLLVNGGGDAEAVVKPAVDFSSLEVVFVSGEE